MMRGAAAVPLVHVARALAVVGALHLSLDGPALSAATRGPVSQLTLALSSTHMLSPVSMSALIAETTAIWKDSRVELQWLTDGRDQPDALRVLVIARVVPASGPTPWAVGELVRTEGARALAIASITGARRIVEESKFKADDLPALRDRRLGVVLGRAVAHEIGHYLLRTSTHSTQGLMRAQIDAREFADLRSGSFRLDQVAQAHLETLATQGALRLTPPVANFSYAR